MDNKPQNLASQASSASQDAAADWQEFIATDGRRYYYNEKTKQSSWDKPLVLMTLLERADASTVWKEFTSAEGKKYYFNKDTKQSKWTIPDELKLAREQAEKESSRGIQSPATLTPSTLDQLSASVTSANDVSSSPVAVTPVISANMHSSPTAKLDNSSLHGASKALEGVSAQDTEASKGKGKAGTSASEPDSGYGIPPGYEFDDWTPPVRKKQAKPTITLAAEEMNAESHPWLRWPNASRIEQIEFNNRLAEIQMHPVDAPRTIDWDMLTKLKIRQDIERMLVTKTTVNNHVVGYDIWDRVFKVREAMYREWCLEFYSTLQVDKGLKKTEFLEKKVVHFRLGGKHRHCTVAEFAFLTGMMEREELESSYAHQFLKNGYWDCSGFEDEVTNLDYWEQISGNTSHSSSTSKVADIRSPILRVFHKMLTYSFLHRSNQNDKVYPDDLWLLRLFSKGAPYRYACAPYILALYMQKHSDKKLVCGHFISTMVRRLGLLEDPANRFCSHPVSMIRISWNDLRLSKLLKANGKELVDEGVQPPPVRRRRQEEPHGPERQDEPVHQPYDFDGCVRQLRQILDSQNQFQEQQRLLSSQVRRLMYHHDYYQPYLQRWVEREAGPTQPPPRYDPPALYMPPQTSGGFYFPSQLYGGDYGAGGLGVGGQAVRPQFSTYEEGGPGSCQGGGDGTPSVFGVAHDMQE